MYVSWMEFVNARHFVSYGCGGVILSFCQPIRAISLLKSPHRMCLWFGCVVIFSVMFCFIIGMYLMSSGCVGMFMCIISHGCNG